MAKEKQETILSVDSITDADEFLALCEVDSDDSKKLIAQIKNTPGKIKTLFMNCSHEQFEKLVKVVDERGVLNFALNVIVADKELGPHIALFYPNLNSLCEFSKRFPNFDYAVEFILLADKDKFLALDNFDVKVFIESIKTSPWNKIFYQMSADVAQCITNPQDFIDLLRTNQSLGAKIFRSKMDHYKDVFNNFDSFLSLVKACAAFTNEGKNLAMNLYELAPADVAKLITNADQYCSLYKANRSMANEIYKANKEAIRNLFSDFQSFAELARIDEHIAIQFLNEDQKFHDIVKSEDEFLTLLEQTPSLALDIFNKNPNNITSLFNNSKKLQTITDQMTSLPEKGAFEKILEAVRKDIEAKPRKKAPTKTAPKVKTSPSPAGSQQPPSPLTNLSLFASHPIAEEPKYTEIKDAVIAAVKKYGQWYRKENVSDTKNPRVKIKAGTFTWLRHGQKGQEKANELLNSVKDCPKNCPKNKTQAQAAIETINAVLMKANTRYKNHSFASFLLDELKNIKQTPWHELGYNKGQQYSQSDLKAKIDGFKETLNVPRMK